MPRVVGANQPWVRRRDRLFIALALACGLAVPAGVSAQQAPSGSNCNSLPTADALKAALKKSVAPGQHDVNGGFGNNEWAVVVDRSGVVCAVTFSGNNWTDQWLGSRLIAAQKAYTAVAFSASNLAVSTANLYAQVQPGSPLFGLQFSNPVNFEAGYRGDASKFGQKDDPMIGARFGGVDVFGGGLALYSAQGGLVGGLGTSGDTSCTDHNIAWKTRHALNFDNVPAGLGADHTDNIIYDLYVKSNGQLASASGYGHPECDKEATAAARDLPKTYPVGPQP